MEAEIPESVIKNMQKYYTVMSKTYPNVMTATKVSRIIDYGKTTVNNWCNKGYIKSFKRNNANHIPKVYLIEFLCSKYFRSIIRKSEFEQFGGTYTKQGDYLLPNLILSAEEETGYIGAWGQRILKAPFQSFVLQFPHFWKTPLSPC